MAELPPITLSQTDHDRIYALLDRVKEPADIIELLYNELDRADILPTAEMPDDVVMLNSTAMFEHEESGKQHTLELVMPQESDGAAGKVSLLAPAGAALLGLRVGDRIEWPSGGKIIHLRLTGVNRPSANK